MLVLLVEGMNRRRSAMTLTALVVASAVLFMLPAADTSIIRHSVGVWNFEVLFIVSAFCVAAVLTVPRSRWPRVLGYLASPALVLLPVALLSTVALSTGVPAGSFVIFWLKCFAVPGVVGAVVLSLQTAFSDRLGEPVRPEGNR